MSMMHKKSRRAQQSVCLLIITLIRITGIGNIGKRLQVPPLLNMRQV